MPGDSKPIKAIIASLFIIKNQAITQTSYFFIPTFCFRTY